ncbi:MAG: hypothetical protein AAFU67_10430 [Bacteroidota bacterium]
MIDEIGPSLSEKLQARGITSISELAVATDDELNIAIRAAGIRYRHMTPDKIRGLAKNAIGH